MPFLTDPAYRKRTNRRNPWQVIWYEVDGARKVRRFRAGFVTRTQAARWWADFREQYEAGELRHDPTTLGDNSVWAIHQDRTGAIWVGTQAGISRLDPKTGKFARYTEKDGLPNSSVTCIQEDEGGNGFHGARLYLPLRASARTDIG